MIEVTLESGSITTTNSKTQQLYENLLHIASDLDSINTEAALIQQEEEGTYGTTTSIPVIIIDEKKNIVSITNTAIAFPAAFISAVLDTTTINLTVAAGVLSADVLLAATQVGFGSGAGVLSGDIGFTYDSITKTLSLGVASTTDGQIVLKTSANAFTTTIKTGVTGASYTLTLPTTDGSAANQALVTNGSGILSWLAFAPVTHDILSTTHSDTLAGVVVRGDLIVGNSTPKWDKLAVGITGTILIGGTDPSYASTFGINAAAVAGTQVYIKSSGSTNATYALKIDNSTSTSLFYVYDSGQIRVGDVNDNMFIGYGSGLNIVGGLSNTAFGLNALANLIGGSQNVAIGKSALANNTYGDINTAIGVSSMSSNISGGYNVAIGNSAILNATGSFNNTAVGATALQALCGDGNTALGRSAGTLSTGNYNVFIGMQAGNRQTVGDNKLFIDNQDRTSAALELTNSLIYGIFNAAVANQYLTINGHGIITQDITTPLIIGGTAVNSPLILRATSGAGTASAGIILQIGNDGSVEAGRIIGLAPAGSATGGTITYDGAYTIHTFTTSGTFTPDSSFNVEYLVVAGGGGAGGGYSGWGVGGGGGGAGGMLAASGFAVTAQAYAITVGAGGSGGASQIDGGYGGDSTFSTITATGGGRGVVSSSNLAGGNGGSGGGTSGYWGTTGGVGIVGQGKDGGLGYVPANYSGGGGGGATSAGSNGGVSTGGAGGAGTANSISGTSVTYAGGGGGAGTTAGAGGAGGGGASGEGTGSGTAGTANTGGGGGSGGRSTSTGGSGGKGIVIIRYLTPSPTAVNALFGLGVIDPTATLHIKAGTIFTPPIRLTSGPLTTGANILVGNIDFLTDKVYLTITTGTARKEFTLNDSALTSGRVPVITTNGRLTDNTNMTFATDTLTLAKLVLTSLTTIGGTAPVADGTYTVGLKLTVLGVDGTITTKSGIITAVQPAT